MSQIYRSALFKIIAILLIFSGICLLYASCNNTAEQGGTDTSAGIAESEKAAKTYDFVGDQSCKTCHFEEWKSWQGSHHDYAMQKPTEETVRGDFNNVVFKDGEDRYRFFRKEDDYKIEAPGPDGTLEIFTVRYTFGWEPLQQYLVDIGQGKLQALHAAWDTQKQRWFSLYPDQQFHHDDWLNWTNGAMNWNTMCADCHSTNVKQNYIAAADSFNTTYSSINVSCEACHGPGGDHVYFMNSDEAQNATSKRISEDLFLGKNTAQQAEINSCASCHSLRQKLTNNYPHTGNFMDHFDPQIPHPPNYFADGQIKGEVYVYGSFLQSKMYKSEGVQCNDCHEPHSLELKANVTDNSLCMQCHASSYDSREHHFHEPNTTASQCINCHMPGRYYMQVDFRRDHSFRIPRPELSIESNNPNACNSCHEDKPAKWAAEAAKKWYGDINSNHYSNVLTKVEQNGLSSADQLISLIADTTQPNIIRATAIWYVGQFQTIDAITTVKNELNSDSPLLRKSAVRAINALNSSQEKELLQPLLVDSVKAVRLSAAEALADVPVDNFTSNYQTHFSNALEDYKTYLSVSGYFPQGQMNSGQFYEQQGDLKKAEEAYRNALKKDPYFNPARINLSMLLNRQGQNSEAVQLLKEVVKQEPGAGQALYSLALLLAEQKKLSQAIPYFKRAAETLPGNARVFYNYAIALQSLKEPQKAERQYLKAINIEPDNPDYIYGLITLYYQQGQFSEALDYANRLQQMYPANTRIQQLKQSIEQKLR